jgi:hypothetical protein
MSVYGVNKVSHLLQADPEFCARMASDPGAAIADLPLSEAERTAILGADVASLYRMGAHTFLLSRIPRFLPEMISRDEYVDRMRSVLSPEERSELERQSREPGQ